MIFSVKVKNLQHHLLILKMKGTTSLRFWIGIRVYKLKFELKICNETEHQLLVTYFLIILANLKGEGLESDQELKNDPIFSEVTEIQEDDMGIFEDLPPIY